MVFDEIICASDDERFMLEALKEAARAAEEGEVPVGAVVVKDGHISKDGFDSTIELRLDDRGEVDSVIWKRLSE